MRRQQMEVGASALVRVAARRSLLEAARVLTLRT
jgi:hypothetical protein